MIEVSKAKKQLNEEEEEKDKDGENEKEKNRKKELKQEGVVARWPVVAERQLIKRQYRRI